MENQLYLFNTLSRRKELFEPLNPPFAGMYVCGPTVYGDPHLGHARPAVTFDIVYRYLLHLGYKVRYVRNITDVGHLENDADEGEDKIAKKARLEQLEPMEVAQFYTDRYAQAMQLLNVKRPSVEPRASGHIIEQIELIKKIYNAGYAYEVNGNLYFDVHTYAAKHHYGVLSGRKIDELLVNTRTLEGQEEKRNPADFALWKKASPGHIMRWPSPWGEGFPGWHLECSAMGCKYLGEQFDIHGGGMDLLFPHHESEIAQSVAANGKSPVRYWLHNNMLTINGQKMGKSLNNFITLDEFFNGTHSALDKAYSPMTIRFFMLQAHYRSTVDFSNEALQAAEKGLKRLMLAIETLSRLKPFETAAATDIHKLDNDCYSAMNDDFNSPIVVANLFEAVRIVNAAHDGISKLTSEDIERLKTFFNKWTFEILGLSEENASDDKETVEELVNIILQMRTRFREAKDWTASDQIRDDLSKAGIIVKDGKDGISWEYK